jgi:hypothetical protein
MHVHGSVRTGSAGRIDADWKPVASAPFDRDLELAVLGYDGHVAL